MAGKDTKKKKKKMHYSIAQEYPSPTPLFPTPTFSG